MEFAELPHIAALLGIIRSNAEFRTLVTALGGYDIADMGKTVYES
jgi:hypothetical protein